MLGHRARRAGFEVFVDEHAAIGREAGVAREIEARAACVARLGREAGAEKFVLFPGLALTRGQHPLTSAAEAKERLRS